MKADKKTIHKATLPQYMNALYLRLKLSWVEWMGRQSARLGRKGQYIALGLFVILSLSCCVLLALGIPGKLIKAGIQPVPISKVKTVNEKPAALLTNDPLLEIRVRAFRKYMDSLAKSPSGLKVRDSIFAARPGLQDSIKIAENIINNRKTSTYEKQ